MVAVAIANVLPSDASAIKRIETRCSLAPWSIVDYRKEATRDGSVFLKAFEKESDVICGFILARLIMNRTIPNRSETTLHTANIHNLGILPQYRHKGIASLLVKTLCSRKDIRYCTLEVRKSNQPAIRFYKKLGFVRNGLRKGFYQDPSDDAVLMNRSSK